MPYLLTTTRPTTDVIPPGEGDRQTETYRAIGAPTVVLKLGTSVSRRAVATLEGRAIWNALYGVQIPAREDVVDLLAALPESGGTVGPLPDGTLVEVEQATAAEMYDLVHPGHPQAPGYERPHPDDTESIEALCDAFNAQAVVA